MDEKRAIIVGGLLFVFGYLFNRFEDYCQRTGFMDGLTWMRVVVGDLVTVVGVALYFRSWEVMIASLLGFACSGFWMMAGALLRYEGARRKSLADMEMRLRGVVDDAEGTDRPA